MMSTQRTAALIDLLRESLKQGYQPKLQVVSDSMAPLLKRGDYVSLSAASVERLEPADIIVFHAENGLVIHRFLTLSGLPSRPVAVTRGDRLPYLDPNVPSESLIGQVVACYRHDRKLNLLQGPGRRLNALLALLSRIEARLYVLPAPPGFEQQAVDLRWPALRGREESLAFRAVRRAIRWKAIALTEVLGSLGRQPEIDRGSNSNFMS